MYSKTKLALKYIQYLLRASNGKGHGVHPPFVYDFIRHVLNSKEQPAYFSEIESTNNEAKKQQIFFAFNRLGRSSLSRAG